MEYALSRTEMLIGRQGLRRLAEARVIVAGLGGVGSYAAEALARSGVGALVLVDADVVALSNINRQLPATTKTVGRLKTEVMAGRIAEIAPGCKTDIRALFLSADNIPALLNPAPDYLIDAIDTVSAKLALAKECTARGIPIISCMGAGNKLDPSRFRVTDIYSTSVCPLCRVMRHELRALGILSLKVVYSDEPPITPQSPPDGESHGNGRRATPGSMSFVPPVAGLIAAGAVIGDIAGY